MTVAKTLKLRPHPKQQTPSHLTAETAPETPYAELHCLSNFSFLRGASHPEELVRQAGRLGYAALALTDRNSLAGAVRAHLAAKQHNLHLIIGAEITPTDGPRLVLLTTDRTAYAALARLLTRGKRRSPKGHCRLTLADLADLPPSMIALLVPAVPPPDNLNPYHACREIFRDNLYLAATLHHTHPHHQRLKQLIALGGQLGLPLVASNEVHYHHRQRRYLHDVLTCIREKCTLADAGIRLFSNAERHLVPRADLARRYCDIPHAIARTMEIARRCTFSLDELRYDYPHELVPHGYSAFEYLEEQTWRGAGRAGGANGIPDHVRNLLSRELALIRELRYEHYFLTVWDLVRFARRRGILCQGRGSAANSAVCYYLGITAVDPTRIDLLFERFVSRERNEPPDIDIDFEHERREEVFQYIYEKYGRERAAITAEVITYRPRSAIRDIGKTLGLSLDRIDALAKAVDWWSDEPVPPDALQAAGCHPEDRTIRMLVRLVRQILGFPRHLSQHVGGFVITESPLCELVPLENGAMPGRTFIEWDKDDIDALGILKVDCLSLGMLSAIRKCMQLVNDGRSSTSQRHLTLRNIPSADSAVYDMICDADTIGVFQIESRAQMSMLPRLKPRSFYDLVIEVAIVRPGPIQGGMIHPYLRRRDGREAVTYPSDEVREVLEKTLGVPLFQEQVMRLAVVAAGFTPGQADQLRRAMAAWRRGGKIDEFQLRLVRGMLCNGYTREFAEQIFGQIRGFAEYGFPESHAASFAHLVYASAWLKRYHPAAFTASILNSLPMGFYAPAQLVYDARRHGVPVLPVDVNHSEYDCTLEPPDVVNHSEHAHAPCKTPSLRLGFRMVRGLSAGKVAPLIAARRGRASASFRNLHDLTRVPDLARDTLLRLAAADAFGSLALSRRQALWQILSLERRPLPLLVDLPPDPPPGELPSLSPEESVAHDYGAIGLTLAAHPLGLIRRELAKLRICPNRALRSARNGQRICVAGLVTHRQRPGTARGMVFMTLEDETGLANLVIRPQVWEAYRAVARACNALVAEGMVERQGGVVHLQVRRFADLSGRLYELRARSRDFR